MGEDAIEACGKFLKAKWKRSRTEKLKLHGYMDVVDRDDPLLPYGSDKEIIQKIAKEKSSYAKKIHPKLPYIMAEVIFALRHEMAFRLEDVFCRRTRALFLDSKSTLEAAPEVAKVLAAELGFDEDWIQKELEAFHEVAKNFTP
jgi:glycerol-3-phosphate dehydrogenase